jgi:hypothetical protein
MRTKRITDVSSGGDRRVRAFNEVTGGGAPVAKGPKLRHYVAAKRGRQWTAGMEGTAGGPACRVWRLALKDHPTF